MTAISSPLAAHLVCMGAGVRDGLRAVQFYVRDLGRADGASDAAWLSSVTARAARLIDGFMTWGANALIALFLPSWRRLPSPFTPGMVNEVAAGIRGASLVQNPLFNAYFFRAAIHILKRQTEPPLLVLEHRVDAARRKLAALDVATVAASETETLARILMALVEAQPVARTGRALPGHGFIETVEPNVAVFSIACITLLFAEEGKPLETLDEDEFFAVAAALIGPRLPAIAAAIKSGDVKALAREIAEIREMY